MILKFAFLSAKFWKFSARGIFLKEIKDFSLKVKKVKTFMY